MHAALGDDLAINGAQEPDPWPLPRVLMGVVIISAGLWAAIIALARLLLG
jgi:hypothetical protein